MSHEEEVIKAFILPRRRERYLECLEKPKKRVRFRRELAHFKALNPKFVVGILPREQTPDSILKILKAKGAGSHCWVISENRDMDGREMDLKEALDVTIGRGMGTFLSCIPGKLAFFENEDGRCILER